MRCWVKSRNERNPYCVLYHSHGTAERNSEEGGDDVKSAWPLRSLKAGLSSDCRLQLAYMKPELLVTAGQHTAVNMFPGLVHTARHVMKAGNTRSRWANRKEAAVEGGVGDWDEVVTR